MQSRKRIFSETSGMLLFQAEIEVYRKHSKKQPTFDDTSINWEETVYLNIILHQVLVNSLKSCKYWDSVNLHLFNSIEEKTCCFLAFVCYIFAYTCVSIFTVEKSSCPLLKQRVFLRTLY